MTATGRRDLDEILDTLREVEASLDRRVARADGAILMVWGVAVASIFAFYQLVVWNHEPYHAALGPALPWMWVVPVLLGYVATAVVGARIGRVTRDPAVRREFRLALLPAAVASVLATVLVVTEAYEYAYGGTLLVCATATLLFAARAPRSPTRTASLGVGGALGLVAMLLLVVRPDWSSGAAALSILVAYVALGTLRYRAG